MPVAIHPQPTNTAAGQAQLYDSRRIERQRSVEAVHAAVRAASGGNGYPNSAAISAAMDDYARSLATGHPTAEMCPGTYASIARATALASGVYHHLADANGNAPRVRTGRHSTFGDYCEIPGTDYVIAVGLEGCEMWSSHGTHYVDLPDTDLNTPAVDIARRALLWAQTHPDE